ncbi:effector binding domain-containing protein [Paenibacillus sp. 481]|nr:effector binding domain-containing protein [Paenibacillus sp. 481]
MTETVQTPPAECQSCGMPLVSEDVLGTDHEQRNVADYCKYCFANGAFTQPSMTMNDMVEYCVPILVAEGMDAQTARATMLACLPNLARWQAHAGQAAESSATSDTEQANLADPANCADLSQPVRLEQRDAIRLIGLAERTTNAREMSANGVIPQLWRCFWEEQVQQQIADPAQPGPIYGCYSDYENEIYGEYKILVGISANSLDHVPAGMSSTLIPASTYAVFTSRRGPLAQVVGETWQAIWKWSATSGMKRAFTGDFELYDERSMNPEDVQIDIYIAIVNE